MAFADLSASLPRTYLFVPGSKPERFAKALDSGADAVIIDLEDAVADQDKIHARAELVEWLSTQTTSVYIRINGRGTPWYEDDIQALGRLDQVAGVVVPKADNPVHLASLIGECRAGLVLLPIIESAAGFAAIQAIAEVQGVQRLLFGTIDFQVDLGTSMTELELNAFRPSFALASRLSAIASPVDGVTTVLDDPELLREAAAQAKRFGFGAKLCIHPKQIEAVHAGLRATPKEQNWAQRVLAAIEQSGGEATVVDGEMVDVPVILRARGILRSVGQAKPETIQ